MKKIMTPISLSLSLCLIANTYAMNNDDLNEQLCHACAYTDLGEPENVAIVLKLLDDGANPNSVRKGHHLPAFFHAAAGGNPEVVRSFLNHHVDINMTNEYGATALSMAAFNAKLPVVNMLLEAQARINEDALRTAIDRSIYGTLADYYSTAETLIRACTDAQLLDKALQYAHILHQELSKRSLPNKTKEDKASTIIQLLASEKTKRESVARRPEEDGEEEKEIIVEEA